MVPLDLPIVIGAEEARRRAESELSKAKYAGPPPWLNDLLERAYERIRRLSELVLQPPGAGQGGINWVFIVTMLVLLSVIALVIWKVGLPRWSRSRRDVTVGTDPSRAPADYRIGSQRAADAGDWLTAVRERFRATVRALEELTILDVRPARTAWEVAILASRLIPDARAALDGAAGTFNDVIYGHRPASSEDYLHMCGWETQILSSAKRADLSADDHAADNNAPTAVGRPR